MNAPSLSLIANVGGLPYGYRGYVKYRDDWRKVTPADVPHLLAQIENDKSITGAGYRNGYGDVRDTDFDLCKTDESVRVFLEALGSSFDTFPWLIESASGVGYRVLYRHADDAEFLATFGDGDVITLDSNTDDFDHLELRRKHNSVIAGQVKIDKGPNKGKIGAYTFVNGEPTEPPPYVTTQRLIAAHLAIAHLPMQKPIVKAPPVRTPLQQCDSENIDNYERVAFNVRHIAAWRADPYGGNPGDDTWLNILAAIHYELGEAGRTLAHEFSAQSTKYDGPTVDRHYDSFKRTGGRVTTGRTLTKLATKDSPDSGKDWARLFKAKPQTPAPVDSTPETVADDATPDVVSFLDHFQTVITDTWLAWLYRYGFQCAMAAYTWNEAAKVGLFTVASAERLACAAEQLGFGDPERHETAVKSYEIGLEKLHSGKMLTTCNSNYSPCGQHFPKPSNDNGVFYLWEPFEHVCGIIYSWAQPRLEQLCYPGYQSPDPDPIIEADRAKRRVMVSLRAEHFTGQAGLALDDATETAAAIMENYPDKDVQAGRAKLRYRRKVSDLFNALHDGQDWTAVAPGAKVHTFTEFSLARYEGKVIATAGKVELKQWEWMQFLGVSKGTLRNLRDRPESRLENIKHVIDDIPFGLGGNVRAQVRDLCKSKKGHLVGMRVYDPVAGTSTPCKYDPTEAERRLADGCGVYPLIQVASETVINPDKVVKPVKEHKQDRAPRTTPYFAPWSGDGFSSAWLWSQIELRLIRHGCEKSAINTLSLPDVIEYAKQPRLAVNVCVETTQSESEVETVITEPELVPDIAANRDLPFDATDVMAVGSEPTEPKVQVEPPPPISEELRADLRAIAIANQRPPHDTHSSFNLWENVKSRNTENMLICHENRKRNKGAFVEVEDVA